MMNMLLYQKFASDIMSEAEFDEHLNFVEHQEDWLEFRVLSDSLVQWEVLAKRGMASQAMEYYAPEIVQNFWKNAFGS